MQKTNEIILWRNENIQKTNLAKFAKKLGFANDWQALQNYSIDKPKEFYQNLWEFTQIIGEMGNEIIQHAPHLKDVKFFPDAKLNYTKNLLNGDNKNIAIISYDEAGNRQEINFADLRQLVASISVALQNEGIKSGDRIAGIVPNSIEAIAIHLGAASIGAIWSSCSPDFGANSIIDRLGQIAPKLLFCANGYHYSGKYFSLSDKISKVIEEIHSIKKVIIFPFVKNDVPSGSQLEKSITFEKWLAPHKEANFAPLDLAFDHPLVILFSSGTTGKPKCLVHRAGGLLLNHKKEQTLHCGISKGDRLFYFTTCGWMMWNWQLSALASGASLVLFDGNVFHPHKNRLFEIISKEKVTHFGTSARYIDECQKQQLIPKHSYDLSSLKAIFSTGSPLSPLGFDYIYENVGNVHLASISGGTDICACFVGGWPVKPVIRGQIQGAMLGLDVDVVNDEGNSIINQAGELICRNAHPSMPLGFWDDDNGELYEQAYFSRFEKPNVLTPSVWAQGDWAVRYDNGGFAILGRSDATLNPGGVRIGTAEIYRQIAKIPEIIESVAIGKQIEADVEIWLFVKLKQDILLNAELEKKIKQTIKTGASPRHVPQKIFHVPDIPITRSGKISEIAVRDVLHGHEVKNSSALANPEALEHFTMKAILGD